MPKITKIALAEYKVFYLADDGKIYFPFWSGKDNAAVATPFTNAVKFVDVYGAQYSGVAVDSLWNAYVLNVDDNKGQFAANQVPNFTDNISCSALNFSYFTVKKDGSVWCWGSSNDYAFPGFGPTPMQISPKGLVFTKIVPGLTVLGLTADGSVYEWSAKNITPVKKNLPAPATDIFASHSDFKGVVVGGVIWAWGNLPYISTKKASTEPVNLGYAAVKAVATWNVLHFIDKNGDLWGLGDNAMGEVGIGTERVNQYNLTANPLVWDWAQPGPGLITTPAKIASGIADIFGSNAWMFYHYALGADGSVYSWGRNKSNVLGNGKANSNESALPNAFDVLAPTKVDPMTAKTKPVAFIAPVVNAGADQKIATDTVQLTGSATPGTTYAIKSLIWTKTSGPACKIVDDGMGHATISGLTSGAYVFQLTMTDNNGATNADTVTITVAIPVNLPPVARTSDQTITLPVNQVTLDGSLSADPDGSIASYKWTKVSGPCGDSISDDTAVKPVLTFQQAGAYVYSLTVKDNAGAAGSPGFAKVTVNPEPFISKVVIYKSDGTSITQQ